MDYNRTTRRKKGEGRKGHNWLLYFFPCFFPLAFLLYISQKNTKHYMIYASMDTWKDNLTNSTNRKKHNKTVCVGE
jgi:hypothetical protein